MTALLSGLLQYANDFAKIVSLPEFAKTTDKITKCFESFLSVGDGL